MVRGQEKKHMKGPRIQVNNQSNRIQIQVCSSLSQISLANSCWKIRTASSIFKNFCYEYYFNYHLLVTKTKCTDTCL